MRTQKGNKERKAGGASGPSEPGPSRRRTLLGELHRLRTALQAQNLRFDIVLGNMRQGLCFFDGSKRLIIANSRYAEIYGIDPGAIRPGMTLREIVDLRFAAGSAPANMSQEEFVTWREGVAVSQFASDTVIELVNGRVIAIHHEPLPDFGWVATHDDITEQRRSEDELRSRNLQFDAAIANMSQGLCMFDANQRMIVCNRNYLRMFSMSADVVKPGITLFDILRHSVDIGIASVNVEELYSIRSEVIAARRAATYRETLADGRTVDIWHRPMADGGWVSTYDDVTERLLAESRIAHMATHDALTGLPNRAFLREQLADVLQAQEASRRQAPLTALLFLDLDRFKAVNDTLGHAAGDKLLRTVAERLQAAITDEDVAARLGGDEFAVLHRAADLGEVRTLAQHLIASLAAPYEIEGQQANVGASVGIALAPLHGSDPEALLKSADLALYRAKADGRGGLSVFEPEMTARAHRRRAIELELREALIRGQFEVHYQPLIHASTERVNGAEALVRWRHPTRGLVSPGEFIPIAEEIGLIAPIGEWVMRCACRDAAQWRSDTRVAVNLSAVQLRGKHLAEIVVSALAAAGLPATRLELEVTESILLEETEVTLSTLHRLRSLGVRVSLDDFGTGYSSLSYLRSFPFDKIKIDSSFVREVAASENGAAIVRAIAGLGASLGMETTAEGVETEEQLELVRAAGCTEVQGYYFSPPRPARELSAFLGRPEPPKSASSDADREESAATLPRAVRRAR